MPNNEEHIVRACGISNVETYRGFVVIVPGMFIQGNIFLEQTRLDTG